MTPLIRIWNLTTLFLMIGCNQRPLNQPAEIEKGSATASSSKYSNPAKNGPLPSDPVSSELGAQEPTRAEFAVRWDPSEGGLANAQEVLSFLKAHRKTEEVFEVRYYDLEPPANAPPDSITILRQRRQQGGKTEIRLKYRRTQPLDENWECPNDRLYEKSEEVDLSFVGTRLPNRVYSYSCTLIAQQPPVSLHAVPKKCSARVVRYEFHKFKIEEWTFPDGNVKLELSRSAENSGAELAKFQKVVTRLLEQGVRPSHQSKTELGSQCP